MAPKKNEAMLLADLRDHIAWIEDHILMLRARTGRGLRGKLRQSGQGKEPQVYKWFSYYADRIASSFALSLSLAVHALDASVNGETSVHADSAGSVISTRSSLLAVQDSCSNQVGLTNLRNTCSINSVLQCLYHCEHLRYQVTHLPPGDTPLGDGLRELFHVRGECPKRCLELLLKFVACLGCVFKHCVGIVEGQQHGAAEFLMHLLDLTHLREVRLCVEEEI